jgi:hypothetical protein
MRYRQSLLSIGRACHPAMKMLKQTISDKLEDNSVDDEMISVIQVFELMTITFTIRDSFRNAGVILDMSMKPDRLIVKEEILHKVQDFPTSGI